MNVAMLAELAELVELMDLIRPYSDNEAITRYQESFSAALAIARKLLKEEMELEALFANDEIDESLFDADCQALETDLEELGAGIESLKVAMEARTDRRLNDLRKAAR